jgi:hypothetical protein
MRERLRKVREGLLNLHRTLLRSEREVYERDIERIASSFQMLHLLMHDPHFEWLRELSTLIVQIDETLDDPEMTPDQADRMWDAAASLVVPEENAAGFAGSYYLALQRDPEVILAHREFTRILQAGA